MRSGASGNDIWTLIGEDNLNSSQDIVPSIEDYMTYDEIKLAAFLQVSSFVKPINSGSRSNRGKRQILRLYGKYISIFESLNVSEQNYRNIIS